jgi:hypothetical protein
MKPMATVRAASGAARFTVVAWTVIIPALAGMLVGLWIGTSGHGTATPHPVPFSCQKLLASLAPVDGGGQIAPLCGQPVTP